MLINNGYDIRVTMELRHVKMKDNDRNEVEMPSLLAVIVHISVSVCESYTFFFSAVHFKKK